MIDLQMKKVHWDRMPASALKAALCSSTDNLKKQISGY